MVFRLFLHSSVAPPVFRCSVSVPPVFHQCSAVPPVFCVPLFRIPAFLILYYAASEGSESDRRDFFSSCNENIDVWSESGSELEEEIFEEQSQNVLFAFEPVGCLGDTDMRRSPTNTSISSDFHRLNGLEW